MRKLHLIQHSYLKWGSIGIAFMLMLGTVADTWAYTVSTRVWSAASTTYVKDANFMNYSAGFSATGDGAAADWNATGKFTFSQNGSSANHLKAQPISGSTALAYMYPHVSGLYRDQYDIVVNTGQGYAFYDGTQSPTLPANYYDLRSILRHEFGHAVGLGHSAAAGTIMYATFAKGESRAIDTDATNGASYLYNSSYAGPFPEGKGLDGSVGLGYWDGTHINVGYKGANWTPGSGFPRAYLATDSYANAYHASAWLAFNGSRITRRYAKTFNRGTEDVFIDGVYKDTIYSNDPSFIRWQVQKTWTVTSGEHIIEVRSNNTSASLYTDLDAFIVDTPYANTGSYDDADTLSNKYIGSWTHGTGWSGPTNGTVSWSNVYQDGVTFTFNGSGITYVFSRTFNRGMAGITIDGNDWGTLDLYAPSTQWQQTAFYPLSAGIHTIHVLVTAQKNSASSGYYVDLDRFIVQ